MSNLLSLLDNASVVDVDHKYYTGGSEAAVLYIESATNPDTIAVTIEIPWSELSKYAPDFNPEEARILAIKA